ncbi:19319_t:CDS:2, partial [Gigaspora rosea]
DDSTDNMIASTSTSFLTKAVSKNKKKASNSIDNFLIRSITQTSDPATIKFFEFLNPNLIFPGCETSKIDAKLSAIVSDSALAYSGT